MTQKAETDKVAVSRDIIRGPILCYTLQLKTKNV